MLHLIAFRNFCKPYLKYKNAVFNGEQEKNLLFLWGWDGKIWFELKIDSYIPYLEIAMML